MVTPDNIAESVIDQMSSQIELFTSLSLAMCGGLLVLATQVLLHNHSRDSSKELIQLKAFYLWIVSFVLEGLAICFGALSRSVITDVTPTIFHLDFSKLETWAQARFPGEEVLSTTATAQFAFFFLGIVAIFLFSLANRETIGGKSRGKK